MFKARIKDDLCIDVPGRLEKIYTDFEPCTTQAIIDELRDGDVFLDIGANFGFFSILAASIVGSSGKVYAVEASPSVLPILHSNAQAFPNIKVIESAAGDHAGTTEFFMTDDFVNSGVALSPFIGNAEKVSVPIDTLDNLLSLEPRFEGRLDFIKCDVQGDEVAVLEGLRKTISMNDELCLIAEWAPAWMNNAGFDAATFPAFIRDLGFRETVIIDDYLKTRMSVGEMEREFAKDTSGKRFCNVFAVK